MKSLFSVCSIAGVLIGVSCLSPSPIGAQANFAGQSNSGPRAAAEAAIKAAAAKPTPRLADGHPDSMVLGVRPSFLQAPIRMPVAISILTHPPKRAGQRPSLKPPWISSCNTSRIESSSLQTGTVKQGEELASDKVKTIRNFAASLPGFLVQARQGKSSRPLRSRCCYTTKKRPSGRLPPRADRRPAASHRCGPLVLWRLRGTLGRRYVGS